MSLQRPIGCISRKPFQPSEFKSKFGFHLDEIEELIYEVEKWENYLYALQVRNLSAKYHCLGTYTPIISGHGICCS